MIETAYHRPLRRIANASLFQAENNISDVMVRRTLEVGSVESNISQRRLLYLARLYASDPPPVLLALLQQRRARDNRRMAWSEMVLQDLRRMHRLGSSAIRHARPRG